MELVNNYFSGSTGTVSRTTGPSGYGPGSDSSGTGGIDFSTLLDAQNVDGKAASGINVTGNDAKGNSVPQTGPARGPANEVKPEALEKKDAGEEIKARTEEDIAALLALVNSLPTDQVSTASGEVELVTSKITTEAKPPSAVALSTSTSDTGGPVATQQNLVPQQDGNSVTMETRNGEDEEAALKSSLESERNGSEVTDTKVANVVEDTKMSREEILKSLEGQGKLVTNSTNTPSGSPSMDTNGPTGRAPEAGSKANSAQMEKGPTGRKADDIIQETKTAADDPAASMPIAFSAAGNTSGADAVQNATQAANGAGTSETMMMRTTETTVADDLTNLLSSRFPAKNGQLTIELDPEKLGKITINVNYDSGHAAVTISATNQKTVELLTQSASAMANIIQQKTGQETNVYIPNTQQSSTKQDMASGRESNENAEQQASRQRQQQASSETSNSSFLQQMRLGLV